MCVSVRMPHLESGNLFFGEKISTIHSIFHLEIILTQKVNSSFPIPWLCNGNGCNLRFFAFCFRSYFGFGFWQFPPFCWHWTMGKLFDKQKIFLYFSRRSLLLLLLALLSPSSFIHTYLQFPIFLKSHHLRAQHYSVLHHIHFIRLSQSRTFYCATKIANEILCNRQTISNYSHSNTKKRENWKSAVNLLVIKSHLKFQ